MSTPPRSRRRAKSGVDRRAAAARGESQSQGGRRGILTRQRRAERSNRLDLVSDPSETIVQADPSVIAGLDYWRQLPIKQQPEWPDAAAVAPRRRARDAPAPDSSRVRSTSFASAWPRAARGDSFPAAGRGLRGDLRRCPPAEQIRNRSRRCCRWPWCSPYGASMPIVKMGRIGRPVRQAALERRRDAWRRHAARVPRRHRERLPVHARIPPGGPAPTDPGVPPSASTLNLIRAFTQGGFADLREVHSWNKGFATNPANQRYASLASEIDAPSSSWRRQAPTSTS